MFKGGFVFTLSGIDGWFGLWPRFVPIFSSGPLKLSVGALDVDPAKEIGGKTVGTENVLVVGIKFATLEF